MTIIDRARDALTGATPGPWLYDGSQAPEGRCIADEPTGEMCMAMIENGWGSRFKTEDAELAALAPELAAEVVRLHDELAALADEWEADAEYQYEYVDSNEAEVSEAAAARIREMIKGE